MIIRERLDVAREELDGAIRTAISSALDQLRRFSPVARGRSAIAFARCAPTDRRNGSQDLRRRAAASSQDFAREMSDRSRSHLELVSSSLAAVAKGFGKLPGE